MTLRDKIIVGRECQTLIDEITAAKAKEGELNDQHT
jgi:hypothetical protein